MGSEGLDKRRYIYIYIYYIYIYKLLARDDLGINTGNMDPSNCIISHSVI